VVDLGVEVLPGIAVLGGILVVVVGVVVVCLNFSRCIRHPECRYWLSSFSGCHISHSHKLSVFIRVDTFDTQLHLAIANYFSRQRLINFGDKYV